MLIFAVIVVSFPYMCEPHRGAYPDRCGLELGLFPISCNHGG
jgi:hypothetical protein